ncbi:unnamed protein product [Brassica oleracea]
MRTKNKRNGFWVGEDRGTNSKDAFDLKKSIQEAKYIKGANVSGIESVFITGGIHGSELDLSI